MKRDEISHQNKRQSTALPRGPYKINFIIIIKMYFEIKFPLDIDIKYMFFFLFV